MKSFDLISRIIESLNRSGLECSNDPNNSLNMNNWHFLAYRGNINNNQTYQNSYSYYNNIIVSLNEKNMLCLLRPYWKKHLLFL